MAWAKEGCTPFIVPFIGASNLTYENKALVIQSLDKTTSPESVTVRIKFPHGLLPGKCTERKHSAWFPKTHILLTQACICPVSSAS